MEEGWLKHAALLQKLLVDFIWEFLQQPACYSYKLVCKSCLQTATDWSANSTPCLKTATDWPANSTPCLKTATAWPANSTPCLQTALQTGLQIIHPACKQLQTCLQIVHLSAKLQTGIQIAAYCLQTTTGQPANRELTPCTNLYGDGHREGEIYEIIAGVPFQNYY